MMEEKTIDQIFAGCLKDLPPVSSKIVRIFTSSTFTDMLMERNTLMEYVYPKIKEYCREKHGLEFQVVDMRWGVRDEMTNEHMTTALCMTELRNCQRLSMGPNFIYFGAQKYGYRPIPTEIITSELGMLREVLVTMGNDVSLLDKWYATDFNAVPAESILQPIDTYLTHFLNKRVPKLQARDAGIWWGTLPKMQLMLRKASHALYCSGRMTHEQMHNYRMAVTEREVINGCLSIERDVKDHIIIYTRIINNINLQNLRRASAFIDIADRKLDQEALDLLAHYRDVLLPQKMKDHNSIYKKYNIEWIGREGLAPETHEEYLNDFINHFYKNVLKLVDRAMRKEDTSAQGKIVTEILQHLHTCCESVKVFYGRTDELEVLKKYVTSDNNLPFVFYGEGGSGKTAMLSTTACKSVEEWLPPAKPLLIVRYLGTTPDSSSLGPLLTSICQQLSYTLMLPFEDIPDDVIPLTAYMKELLTKATKEVPLLICLDSVDQLVGSQDGNKMSWLPTKIPPYCKIIVSCTREKGNENLNKDYELLRQMICKEENFLEVTALGEKLAWNVVKLWMETAGRDLNNYQWRVVANAVSKCSLPIFCKLVFAEICRWKSYSKPEDTYLMHNVMDSIFLLYEKVETKHGWLLVSHALAYVTASKSGVSETELEDLISLDDKVLDDIYQYHLPPTRRIPPLLWTRVRNDLPGYLSDSEADGVSVINWYHRQFKEAALQRYFKTEYDVKYFHSMLADFFLGKWGGGIPKPFKFTEIQKHRFGLKSKDSEADRQLPAMPLVFMTKEGKISRYNLRKFGELPFHLVRCKQFGDLYSNVLFNYQWLYAKMSACPLQSVLSDFEDACQHLDDEHMKCQIMLVADSLRLGGAILGQYPNMLAPQLTGRLLSVVDDNLNIQNLLKQCDEEGPSQNALVPAFHCMHTPGGPLKYSLEGHQFAIFGFKLTPDLRYIVSVSNKFITWDVSTSDLVREVSPGVSGLMMDVAISPDNRFIAAYTSNNEIILLNALISELTIIKNPFRPTESIIGLVLLDSRLIVYGKFEWTIYNTSGKMLQIHKSDFVHQPILSIQMTTIQDYSIINWSGDASVDTSMILSTSKGGIKIQALTFHSAIVLNKQQTKVWVCPTSSSNRVAMYKIENNKWEQYLQYEEKSTSFLQLSLSMDESYVIGTFHSGFHLWKTSTSNVGKAKESNILFQLPYGIYNVSRGINKSSSCVLSANNQYGIAGIRKDLYIWDVKTGNLVKTLAAHFGRILDVQPLSLGRMNTVITSSIDRTVKVWNINNIFGQVHQINRHELQIDAVSLSTSAGIAVTVTRNCIGVWDLLKGQLKTKLADSPLGAIITHALVSSNGKNVLAIESGFVIHWDLETEKVIHKCEQDNVKQIFFYDEEQKSLVVSTKGTGLNAKVICKARSFPDGITQFEFEVPYKHFKNIVLTSDSRFFVAYGLEKSKDTFFVYKTSNGELSHKFLVKYPSLNAKSPMLSNIFPMQERPGQIVVVDQEKGNIIDVVNKKFVRSIRNWYGVSDKSGRYGVYAPSKGGLDLIDLRTGNVKRQLIPKIAEGIFNIICKFNETNEYVLYYHSGRKTLRVFRVSDGEMIANYRVPSDLSSIQSTTDGNNVALGMVDGSLTVLTIADTSKPDMKGYLKTLPSRSKIQNANSVFNKV